MKRLVAILLAAGALFVLMHSSASAETKSYVSLRAGTALPEFERDDVTVSGKATALVGFTFGIQPSDIFRWDLVDISYFSGAQSSPGGFPVLPAKFANGFGYSNLNLGTGMRWGYFGEDWKLHPYVSFGISANRSIYEESEARKSRWYFEWNIGGGIEYDIIENFGIGLRYKYSDTDYKALAVTEEAHKISAEIILMLFQ
ncbi:MAG: outer membrane beta-barrel protein [Myxococcota bacterium]|nr:outer membrane beta-barrel protein [Myxococcota bacterium]